LADLFSLANNSFDTHYDIIFKTDFGWVHHEDIEGLQHFFDLSLISLVFLPVDDRPNDVPALANHNRVTGFSRSFSDGSVLHHNSVNDSAEDLENVGAKD
jgi:hypothetical protein